MAKATVKPEFSASRLYNHNDMYAVVELAYPAAFVIPAADLAALIKILSKAERVADTYNAPITILPREPVTITQKIISKETYKQAKITALLLPDGDPTK